MVNLTDILSSLKEAAEEDRPVVTGSELKKIEDYYLASCWRVKFLANILIKKISVYPSG